MIGVVIAFVVGGLLGGAAAAFALRRSRAGRGSARHPGATAPGATAPGAAAASTGEAVRRAELVSKISHELKNPVMSVKGLASTGARLYDSISDRERLELFRLIDAEAGRLKLIAEETSTTLKIDAGTLAYDFGQQDLGRLVEETVWRTPVGDHPVSVTAEPGLVARADRTRLAEALANLVDNAAKYSPVGAEILVRAARADGGIGIEVQDGGPGIPAERRASVFDRYGAWRPEGYAEVPGAGLGLYIARAHVAAHNGRIDIRDAEPRGTILRVWLPTGG